MNYKFFTFLALISITQIINTNKYSKSVKKFFSKSNTLSDIKFLQDTLHLNPLNELETLDAARSLITHDPTLVTAKDFYGNTILHTIENPEIAKFVIAKGADINATNYEGLTPLESTTNLDIAEILINAGAKIPKNFSSKLLNNPDTLIRLNAIIIP